MHVDVHGVRVMSWVAAMYTVLASYTEQVDMVMLEYLVHLVCMNRLHACGVLWCAQLAT